MKLETERGKVNHHKPDLIVLKNVRRYLRPPTEFKEPLPTPLTAQLKDPGKSFIFSTASHTCVRSLLPTTWCSRRRSRGGWKYHSVRGRAAIQREGEWSAPHPARKEPPLAAVRALGKQNSRCSELGMGHRALPAPLDRHLGDGNPSEAPACAKSRQRSLFLPRDQMKARRAGPGEAAAALIPKAQPRWCLTAEIPPKGLLAPTLIPCLSQGTPGLSSLLRASPPALGRIQPAANPANPWRVPLEAKINPGSRCLLLKP